LKTKETCKSLKERWKNSALTRKRRGFSFRVGIRHTAAEKKRGGENVSGMSNQRNTDRGGRLKTSPRKITRKKRKRDCPLLRKGCVVFIGCTGIRSAVQRKNLRRESARDRGVKERNGNST